LNEIAEGNKFVVIYPMVSLIPLNSKVDNLGCWDFFGYTNKGGSLPYQYMSKEAP